MSDDVKRDEVGVIRAVKCAACGRLHAASTKTYVVFRGSVIGPSGGKLLSTPGTPVAYCGACLVKAVWHAVKGSGVDPGPAPQQVRNRFMDPV